MNGLIIINSQQGGASYKVSKKVERLGKEFKLLGVNIDVLHNDGTLAVIENGDIKLRINKYDFVIYLDKDRYLADLLTRAGYRLFDKADFIELCDDKMLTHIRLANYGIPMPKTIAGPLVFDSKSLTDFSFLEKIEKEIGYPMIIKGVYGSLGQNMTYIANKEDLYREYKKMAFQPILFQQYITTSYGRSVRCIVINKKIFGAFERFNPNDYRSNYSKESSSKEFKMNEEFSKLALKISDLLDIEYAGIDFLFGENGRPLLCEINSNAFFEEFEKITKLNVGKAFAEMIIDKVKKAK